MKHTTRFSSVPDSKLISDAFKYAAWGALETENRLKLQEIEAEAASRLANLSLPYAIYKSRLLGEKAHTLGKELPAIFKAQGVDAARAWISEQSIGHHARLNFHLTTQLEKLLSRQETERARRVEQKTTGWHSTLAPVTLNEGIHPNSIRHLPRSNSWQLLIDETGLHFDSSADEMPATSHEVGRVVALVVPEGHALPRLEKFHAYDAPHSETDKVLHSVLSNKVGVFGFTVQDPTSLGSSSWIAHVEQLIRWVLRQLPIHEEKTLQVNCLIEQRGDYQQGYNLNAIAEILEGECRRLDEKRFGKLKLSLELMDKNAPLNGYVDAVAYTWGSNAAQSEDRLKKSKLLGHCLLRPQDRALERLYLALSAQRALPASDWYDLCAATDKEPRGGLLTNFLNQLGEKAQANTKQWQTYLEETRHRMRVKNFRLNELGAALQWLETWQPLGSVLPAGQRLQLEAARLAADNHSGHIDMARIATCLSLSQQLRDEDAVESCSTLLRISATTTNAFEFSAMLPTLQSWLAEPIAVPGLLNYAKLHSSVGQLLAFQGNARAAVPHFEQAIAALGRLSDQEQATKDSQQTRTYQLIARMDSQPDSAWNDDFCTHMAALAGKNKPVEISRSLAHAGQEKRFPHHLWLRALALLPEYFSQEREAYLALSMQWQDGNDHPWPLINAYRAWLLLDAGRNPEATQYLQRAVAVAGAAKQGPVLQWMAEVLRTLGQGLGIEGVTPSDAERTRLTGLLSQAPHAALAKWAAVGRLSRADAKLFLNECLPFNFH